MEGQRVNLAILLVADTPSPADQATFAMLRERLTGAGHHVVEQATVADKPQPLRAGFLKWIADPSVDAVIAIAAADSQHTQAALAPSITKPIEGFSELVRMISFEEIGTGAMLVDVAAAQCSATFVFVLPASMGAVRSALDKLLIPQLDSRTKPRNLVMRMARFKNELKPADDAIPQPVPRETTAIGLGAQPRLPATPPAPPAGRKLTPPIPVKVTLPPRTATPPPPNASESHAAIKLKELWAAGPPAPAEPTPAAIAEPKRRTTDPNAMVVDDATLASMIEPDEPAPEAPARGPIEVRPPTIPDPLAVAAPRRSKVPSGSIDDIPTFLPPRIAEPPLRKHRRRNTPLILAILAFLASAAAAGVVIFRDRNRGPDQPPPIATVAPPPLPPVAQPIDAAEPDPNITLDPPTPPDAKLADLKPVDPKPADPKPADRKPDPKPPDPKPPDKLPDPKPADPKPADVKPEDIAKLPPNPTDGSECDEVSCILEKYARPCCARWKPVEQPPPPPKSTLPETLDKTAIRTGVDPIRPAITRCGELHPDVKGTVKVMVTVNPEGGVDDVSIAASPDGALGDCVATAIRRARFTKSRDGAQFGYPFVF